MSDWRFGWIILFAGKKILDFLDIVFSWSLELYFSLDSFSIFETLESKFEKPS